MGVEVLFDAPGCTPKMPERPAPNRRWDINLIARWKHGGYCERMTRALSRRTAFALGAGAAALPLVARAQDAPLGYGFGGPLADLDLDLAPTAECGIETAAQADGPFYIPLTPHRSDLIQTDGLGTPLILAGLVMTPDCQPIAGAVMDFWHCDDAGVYDNAGFRYRGHQFTDASGAYRLRTIRPGKYPARTQHIHIKMQGPETQRLTTQIYFPDRPEENAVDRVYRDDLVMALRQSADEWVARFDFVLAAA